MPRKLLLLVFILMLCACAGSEKLVPVVQESESRPTWIDALPQQQDALYGIASVELGDSSIEHAEQQAKQQAVNGLKQQVQIELKQRRLLLSSDQSRPKISANLHQEISTRTPAFSLSFVEPVESYCDVDEQRVYALARLDIPREIAAAKRKSEQLNAEIQQHAESIVASDRQALRKVQGITKTLVALEQRQQLHAWAKQLQPDGEGLPMADELLDIQHKVLQGVEQTPISISPLSGQGVDITISQVLSEQLRQRGLVVLPESGQLQLRYSLTQINRYQNDTFFVTINGLIQLHDAKQGALMSLKVSGDGNSSLEDDAIREALAKLGQLAAEEVIEVLFGVK